MAGDQNDYSYVYESFANTHNTQSSSAPKDSDPSLI